MDRKDFLKSTCGLGIGSCFGLGLFANKKLFAAVERNPEPGRNTPIVPVDTRQIQNVLCYIDSSMDESVKKSIFERLGAEHLAGLGFKNWINNNKNNLKGYFDKINSNQDTYWEKIEYNQEASTIKITGETCRLMRLSLTRNMKIHRYRYVSIVVSVFKKPCLNN